MLCSKNCAVDFVEICNVCTRKVIIKDAKRMFNSDKICRSHCDFYFGVTFLEHTVYDGHQVKKIKVTGTKKTLKIHIPQCKIYIDNNSGSIKRRATKCACSMVFLTTADRRCDHHLCHMTRNRPHVTKCTLSWVVGRRRQFCCILF